jgi:hypothetical protein
MRVPSRAYSRSITATEQLVDRTEPPQADVEYTSEPADVEDGTADDCLPGAEWFPFVETQLQAIAVLPLGWDSYGSPSPDRRFVLAALDLIACLARVDGVPQPHVNPTRAGGVQFEWENGDRYFELELVDEDTATYYWRDYSKANQEEGKVSRGDCLDTVLEYVRRVGV